MLRVHGDLSDPGGEANCLFRVETFVKASCTFPNREVPLSNTRRRSNFHVFLTVTLSIVLSGPFAFAVPAQGHKIMVAGPSPNAVDIARAVSLKGGNVVDVAVAMALSLSVTHPYYAALGGGGFALVKMNGKVKALDFREMAPGQAGPDLYKDKPQNASTDGGLAVGVPGIPAGLWELHKTYGKLKWKQLFTGALELSTNGFRVSGDWSDITSKTFTRFNPAGKQVFFKNQGKKSETREHLLPGEILKQPQLAKALRAFRDQGPKGFYAGAVAKDIVSAVKDSGGIISLEDLKHYKTRWLEPLTTNYAGYKIYLMPPPSSGGVVIAQAVQLIEKLDLKSKPELSALEYHYLGEIMKLSYRGRALLGDPDFAKNPIANLLSPSYIASLASKVKPDKSIPVEPLKSLKFESTETTHFSVMDSGGNAVSMTVTLNGNYGSAVVTPKFGIALNNEMDDFTTRPGQPNMFGLIQGDANKVRAGARPLSSMSPTLVEKDGQTVLAVGAPGGPRIISGVLQVLYRVLQREDDVDWAIQAPRVHHQFLPDVLYVDTKRFSPEVLIGLKALGHEKIESGSTAKVYAVKLEAGILSGAYDSRGEGAAGGY